jgi:hypothetical protein
MARLRAIENDSVPRDSHAAFVFRFVITSAEMSIDTVSSDSEREDTLTSRNEAGSLSDKLTQSALRGRGFDLALLIATLVLAAGGALWAIDAGVSTPLALMVGYCTATSTIALYAASRLPRPVPVEETERAPAAPGTSEAWKLVKTLTVSDASRLWCDIEPGATTTQETMAWGRALMDAIKRGELPIVLKPGMSDEAVKRERDNPHYMTQVTRDALQAWASAHGYAPNFLR